MMAIGPFWRGFILGCLMIGFPSGVHPIPEDTVTASLYGTGTLRCTFPFINGLTDLTMIWEKEEEPQKIIVYKLLNGKDDLKEQDPQYRGRVALLTDVSKGNLDLTLRDVTYEDQGTFHCRAANTKGHGEKKVTFTIDSLQASDPTVTLVTIDGKRRMKCRGSGVYRVPQVQWITARGQDLSHHGVMNVTEPGDGRKLVESVLDYDVGEDVQVLCHIIEGKLKRSARAVISDGTHSVKVEL
ncbi:V-set domain-containing T-cell activation inhibitor 1-like [Engystomops pustulosus]|uniref:V-set domain-containing T-cell activation inhibitor 1-like n=1 Tax=Engystomops pustulosus TaxID=76066 RepID=UPI003AFA1F35